MTLFTYRRIAKGLAGLLFFSFIAGMVIIHAPLGSVFSSWVENRMGDLLDAQVTIGGLDFSIYRGMHAQQLTIRPETLPDESVTLTDVSVEHSVAGLLIGRYRMKRIDIGNINTTITPGLITWASGKLENQGTDSGNFPDISVGDGVLDLGLSELLEPLQVKPFDIDKLRFSVRQHNRHISGMLSFAVGANDVRLRFEAAADQGFIESEVEINGFDLSFLKPLRVGEHYLDPSRMKVSGVLSGTVTYLTSSRQWVGGLLLSGVAAGLPETGLVITNGRAGIQLSDGEVTIHGGDFHALGGQVTIPLVEIGLGEEGIEVFRFSADTKGLDLPLVKESGILMFLPERFHPDRLDSGQVDASIDGRWHPVAGFDYQVDAMLQNVSGLLKNPEVEFSRLKAQADMKASGAVRIKAASANFWDGRVEIDGSLSIVGDGRLEDLDLDIQIEDMIFNDTLMGMLPEPVQKGIRFAGPSNVVKGGGDIKLAEAATSLELTVVAEKLVPFDLPIEFENATGTIKWIRGTSRILFEDVSGTTSGNPVRGNGVLRVGDGLEADFTVLGKDIGLSREILDWLHVDIGDWQVDGRFDLALQAMSWRPVPNSVIASLSGIESAIDLKGVSLDHPEHGRVGRSLYGTLEQTADGLDLKDFKGDVYAIAMTGSGVFPFQHMDKKPYLLMKSEIFELNPDLYHPLPFETGLEEMGLGGRGSIETRIVANFDDGLSLSGEATATLYDMNMVKANTSMGASGAVRLHFLGERFWGNLSLHDVHLSNLAIEKFATDFNYNSHRLHFEDLNIEAYGGNIVSDEVYVNTKDKFWETRFDIDQLDLGKLIKSFDVMDNEVPEGILRSGFTLNGVGFDTHSIEGRADVKIDDGKLYSFPILVAVLSLFDLRLPTQSPVTNAIGSFGIGNGQITIEDLLFTGGSLPIYMEGYVGLQNHIPVKDQPLYLIVTLARNESILDRIPLVGILKHYTIDLLRRLVFQARVGGTLGDYKVTTISSPITDQIQKMWSFLENAVMVPED